MAEASGKACEACERPVSFAEELDIGHGSVVHLKCFKCAKCQVQLTPSDKYQLVDRAFYCKDHKVGGIAKQLQQRAKRSLKSAMKGAPKLFATPSKQKPPKEVGVPTTVPLDSPYAGEGGTRGGEEDEEDVVGRLARQQQLDPRGGDDFVTVIDDADDHPVATTRYDAGRLTATMPSPHSIASKSVPSATNSGSGGVMMMNSLDVAPASLRRASTAASTHSLSQISPSLQASVLGTNAMLLRKDDGEHDATRDAESPILIEGSQGGGHEDEGDEEEGVVGGGLASIQEGVVAEDPLVDEDKDDNVDDDEGEEEGEGDDASNRQEEEVPSATAAATRTEMTLSPTMTPTRRASDGDFGAGSTIVDSHSVAMFHEEEARLHEELLGGFDDDDDEDDEDEEPSPEKPPKPSDPLKILTTAVAKELEILPQSLSAHRGTDNLEDDHHHQEEVEQPWVYPPAFSGVSPIQISVVDPDHLWMFIESPLQERMLHSKVGGAKRAKFIVSDALKPVQPVAIYSRYRNPYLHMYLVRCETIQEYTSSIRPRLKAFKEDVEHREDPEWLLVLVESSPESKKVYDKIKQDFSKERVVTVNVSDDSKWLAGPEAKATRLRPAGDGQWGDLAQRVGTSIVRAYEHRRPIYKRAIDDEVEREMDWNYFNVFIKAESLAFASLQVDRYEEALELYTDLNMRFKRAMEERDPLIEKVVKCGMIDESGSSVKRLPCWKLLFPAVSSRSTEQDAIRAQIHRTFPARVFDVERLPFRDLIGTSTVSGIQLQMYLFARVVLCLLALGRAREAIETSRQFLFALRTNLRLAYPKELTCVDAWTVAASLEVVAAGHACASVFASEVDPADRVGMCLAQALLLERARAAMEDISARQCPSTRVGGSPKLSSSESSSSQGYGGGRRLIPELALHPHPHLLRETTLPQGLARAFYHSPDSFRNMYGRLLEASAAHFVASGRFRFAASLTHRRAILLFGSGSAKRQEDAQLLFEDAGRWWSGQNRTVVFGEGTADLGTTLHDDWPSLRAETCLYAGHTERIARAVKLVRPAFRRRALASRICREAKTDHLIPVELRASLLTTTAINEDDVWTGEIEVEWTLPELVVDKGMWSWKDVEKVSIVYKQQQQQQQSDPAFVEFVADCTSVVDNNKTTTSIKRGFQARSTSSANHIGVFSPSEAFIYIRGTRMRALLGKTAVSPIIVVVERPFPYVVEVVCPRVVASGTSFVKQAGESDEVSSRQEFVLRIKRREATSSVTIGPCEAIVSLSEGMELCEAKDGKASVTSLAIRFSEPMEKRLSVVVASKNKKEGSGAGSLFVDLKSLNDSRTAPRHQTDFKFHPPIQVTHDIRFAGEDVAAISLIVENNVAKPFHQDLGILGCALTNVSTEETMMKASPVSPFPFRLASGSPLTQTFILYGLNSIVPERAGGKSVVILQATVTVRFVEDATECTLAWYVPLMLRRAEVVRQRWKEGESLSFFPAIEDASFGMDWKEVMVDDEDDAMPIVVIDESADGIEDVS